MYIPIVVLRRQPLIKFSLFPAVMKRSGMPLDTNTLWEAEATYPNKKAKQTRRAVLFGYVAGVTG